MRNLGNYILDSQVAKCDNWSGSGRVLSSLWQIMLEYPIGQLALNISALVSSARYIGHNDERVTDEYKQQLASVLAGLTVLLRGIEADSSLISQAESLRAFLTEKQAVPSLVLSTRLYTLIDGI